MTLNRSESDISVTAACMLIELQVRFPISEQRFSERYERRMSRIQRIMAFHW